MYLTIYLILATALIGLSPASCATADNEATNKWLSIYGSVFGKPSPSLKPEEILEKLKLLDDLFPDVKVSQPKTELWKSYRKLIEVVDISPERCSEKELRRFSRKIFKYGQRFRQPTIVSFLEYYRGKQYESCRPGALKKLEEAVGGLKTSDRENVVRFVNDVLKYDGDEATIKFSPSFNAVTRASVDLLKQMHPELSKKTPKDEFEQLFANSVVGSCETITEQLYEPLEFYKALLNEKKVDQTLEQFVIDWNIRNKVCRALSKVQLSALDVAHKVLRGKYHNKKRLLDPKEVLRKKQAAREYKEYKERVEMNKRLCRRAANRDKEPSCNWPFTLLIIAAG